MICFVVNPQEATESPGSSEELETGVEPLKQAQEDTKTRDDRQHAELSTLHPPGLNCLLDCCSYKFCLVMFIICRICNLQTLHQMIRISTIVDTIHSTV